MSKLDYVVTEAAGPHVAGRRVARGATISLTEEEARFELLAGTIRRPSAPAAAQPEKAEEPNTAPPAAKKR